MKKNFVIFALIISFAFSIISCADEKKGDTPEMTTTQSGISATTNPVETTALPVDLTLGLKKYTVTADRSKKLFEANFNFGITHTHYMWEQGYFDSVKNATDLISSVSAVNNQHIMGWGAGNPWPSKDGPINFSSIDSRISLFKKLGGDMWLTFCQAPGWMKGAGDWEMEKSVLDEHIGDFAYMCAEIAKHFPEVTTFQVWNEFKGYWSSAKNEWDYERYTKMYNEVYKAVKAVRPDAKIGGFYIVLEGDGTRAEFGIQGTHDYTPLNEFQRRAIKYWCENAEGADYILVDRGIIDYHNSNFKPTAEQAIILTKYYQKVTKEIAELTELPIVYSEYYGSISDQPVNGAFTGAQYASVCYNMIMGAGGRDTTALLWMEAENNIKHALFTDTAPGGGKPTPHFNAMKYLTDNFPAGTALYDVQILSDGVTPGKINDKLEVLASDKCTYVINKTNEDIYVETDGVINILPAYGVQAYDISGHPMS